MGQPKIPVDVKLFIAVTFSDDALYEQGKVILENEFGPIEIRSAIFNFEHTRYYYQEMGGNLKKQLLGFEKLIPPDILPDIKLKTNALEEQFMVVGNRRLNLDPGYLAPAKVVLATTKNFDHRIYLGKGIYGDVQLRFRKKKFHFNNWTYPDYKDMYVIEFLTRLRRVYMKEYERLTQKRG